MVYALDSFPIFGFPQVGIFVVGITFKYKVCIGSGGIRPVENIKGGGRLGRGSSFFHFAQNGSSPLVRRGITILGQLLALENVGALSLLLLLLLLLRSNRRRQFWRLRIRVCGGGGSGTSATVGSDQHCEHVLVKREIHVHEQDESREKSLQDQLEEPQATVSTGIQFGGTILGMQFPHALDKTRPDHHLYQSEIDHRLLGNVLPRD